MTAPEPASRHTISAPQLFDGTHFLGPSLVTIADGRIESVRPAEKPAADARALPADSILAPGFIDVQVNGGGGVLLNDEPTEEGVRAIVAAHHKSGTTGCLPTLITDVPEVMQRLAASAAAASRVPGVLGFHLEGPLLNTIRKGIHLESAIRTPTSDDLAAMRIIGRLGRSIVTLAPECVHAAVIDELLEAGFRLCVGHSDATGAQVKEAADRGVTGVTHLFNAMSQVMPREPGVAGAALADDRLFAGMICDGAHVDPMNLRIAARCKGADRLMLVTDAMALVGTDQRQFMLQGRPITLNGNRLTGADGTFAGAHVTMIQTVRNAVELMGVDLATALRMASRTPATFLGLQSELGAIKPGYRADLVAFTGGYDVIDTWIAGRAGHEAN